MKLSSLHQSFLYHGALIFLVFILSLYKQELKESYLVPINFEETNVKALNLQESTPDKKIILKTVNTPSENTKTAREVFGLNRQSYTDSVNGSIDAKAGNTTAKKVDDIKLQENDADSLPTPTEEYLVSQMPRVITEIKPTYPKLAKEKEIEGIVALEILIDEQGRVRQANIISGPGFGLENAALQAIYQFRFSPAKVEGSSVAVKIRYNLKFVLEK